MSTTAATFCVTMVDEWIRAGVTNAFAAPGSRSTPLALALQADQRLSLSVFHDERAASFAALGHAMATGQPSVLTCTSGTAAAHFHAAVIEADLSAVPLIVCTTDRPPELWDVGAPQTVDQTGLFGGAVRFFAEPGVPSEEMRDTWRSLGSRLAAEAAGGTGPPGPVHVNLSFRDPLVGTAGELPTGRDANRPWHLDLRSAEQASPMPDGQAVRLWRRLRGLSGVLVAGHGTSDPGSVLALGRRLGWPVLADHRSGCRAEGQAVAHFDQLLRIERFAAEERPDVVIRFGQPLASKVVSQWLSSLDAEVIAANPRARWTDPERQAGLVVAEAGLARALLGQIPADYRADGGADRWSRADELAEKTITDVLARAKKTTEPGVARSVVEHLPAGASLLVASSMPVRDVEWFAPNRRDLRVYANRGANGIDGLIATATGIALTGAPTTLLIGDVAFLHDSTALVALKNRAVDLTIVIVDNDGGGIFSFLPQAELVAAERFEQLFGTPHGTDLEALCRAYGIPATAWPTAPWPTDTTTDGRQVGEPIDEHGDPVAALLGGAIGAGVRAVVATTDRADNVRIHDYLNRMVADVVTPTL